MEMTFRSKRNSKPGSTRFANSISVVLLTAMFVEIFYMGLLENKAIHVTFVSSLHIENVWTRRLRIAPSPNLTLNKSKLHSVTIGLRVIWKGTVASVNVPSHRFNVYTAFAVIGVGNNSVTRARRLSLNKHVTWDLCED
jgi:hypothetical protein